MVYSLYIRRYKRNSVVEALTTFHNEQFNNEGVAHNNYQDFSVYAFKAGAEI